MTNIFITKSFNPYTSEFPKWTCPPSSFVTAVDINIGISCWLDNNIETGLYVFFLSFYLPIRVDSTLIKWLYHSMVVSPRLQIIHKSGFKILNKIFPAGNHFICFLTCTIYHKVGGAIRQTMNMIKDEPNRNKSQKENLYIIRILTTAKLFVNITNPLGRASNHLS